MDALLDAICDYAADDAKWPDGQVKVAQDDGGGFQLDPRTMAMAALGAGGLAGGGALSGRLSGKQLALLALLGAAAGGGGNELYKYLQQDDDAGGGGDAQPGLVGRAVDAITPDINPSLKGALGTGLVGLGAGAGAGTLAPLARVLSNRGEGSVRSILTAPTPEVAQQRLANFMREDADLQQRFGGGDGSVPDEGQIQNLGRRLWQFGQAQGVDPANPRSARAAEEMLRSGSFEFDFEDAVPEEYRQQIQRRNQLFTQLADQARAGNVQQDRLDPRRFTADPTTRAYKDLQSQITELEQLRERLGDVGEGGDLDNLRARGRMNLATGEVPDLEIDGQRVGRATLPTSFGGLNRVRNRLNQGVGSRLRRITPRWRGVGGLAAGGAGLGALVGGLFGND